MNKKSLGIMSVGSKSTYFATQLAAGLFFRRKNRYINNIVTYNYDNDTRLGFLKNLGLPYKKIALDANSLATNKDISQIAKSLQVFQQDKQVSHLVLFVDMDAIKDVTECLQVFCLTNANLKILLICYINGLTSDEVAAYVRLIATLRSDRHNVLAPILLDTQSQLCRSTPKYWEKMIVKSFVFSLMETMTSQDQNDSLFTQLSNISAPAAGIGIISQGVSPMTIWGKILFLFFRRSFCFLPTDLVLKKMLESTNRLVKSQPIIGSIGTVDFQSLLQQGVIGFSFITPYRKSSRKYKRLTATLQYEINNNIIPANIVIFYSSNRGEGIDSSSVDPQAKGNFHLQTMLIYPYVP